MQRSNEAARSAEFLELLKKCPLYNELNEKVRKLEEELRLLKSKQDPSVEQSVKRSSPSELKTKSRDGYLHVLKNEYKLHARRSFYQISFTSDPTRRPKTDLENQLEVCLTKQDGHTVKFTKQQTGDLPWFSIHSHHTSPAGKKHAKNQKWHLNLHSFRTHWNRAWSGMTCAWLKISVADDCYIRIKITYDKDKRRKTKKIYKNKQRKKIKSEFKANAQSAVSYGQRMPSPVDLAANSFSPRDARVDMVVPQIDLVASGARSNTFSTGTGFAPNTPVVNSPTSSQAFVNSPTSSQVCAPAAKAALKRSPSPLLESLPLDEFNPHDDLTAFLDDVDDELDIPQPFSLQTTPASPAFDTSAPFSPTSPASSVLDDNSQPPSHYGFGAFSPQYDSTPPCTPSPPYHYTQDWNAGDISPDDEGISSPKKRSRSEFLKQCRRVLESTPDVNVLVPMIRGIKAAASGDVQRMLAIARKTLRCQWLSLVKLGLYASKHVATMAKTMVHLVAWRFRTAVRTAAGSRAIEEVWSGSAFLLCGKRKLAITAKHNVEGVEQRGQGVLFAYTHPRDDAAPHSGEHFATVVDFVGDTAVLELHALHPDSATDAPPLHAARLAEVGAKQGDKIRVVGIASIEGDASVTRVLALTPGTVTSPGSNTGYREDGLVPCDLTLFEGLSGGAMTTENGCVVALAEGVHSRSGRMAFATDLVGLRGGLEDMLQNRYNCGIGDLVTDDPASWAFTEVQTAELDDRIDARVRKEIHSVSAKAEADRSARTVASADILKARIEARVYDARAHFTGRDWLAKQLVESLGRLTPQKAVLITGTGGTGKSFFFDRLLDPVACTNLGGHWAWLNCRILARHCCMYKYSDSLDANMFLDSLVGQLLEAIQGSGRIFTLDDKDKTRVDKMLYNHLDTPKHTEPRVIVAEVLIPALKAMGDATALGGRCVFLVDSLDEAQCGGNIVSAFVELVRKSPSWVQWVATSRPDAAVRQELKPVEGGSIELGLEGANQESDVREYVEMLLPVYPSVARLLGIRMPAMQQVDAICKKARGLFKYAVMAVQKLKDDPDMDLNSLPDTLEELYLTFFERKYSTKLHEFGKYVAPMLATLVASRDALPGKLVGGQVPESRAEWPKQREHLQFVQHNLCERRLLGEKSRLMQFGHKTFVDFLQSPNKAKDFVVCARRGHKLLARRCKRELTGNMRSDPTNPCVRYALRHLVRHLCYLHEHPLLPVPGTPRPDRLKEAARVVLSFDWILGRVMLDKNTKGVQADGAKVAKLLRKRRGAGDAELRECVEVVMEMTKCATRAVHHDPRQILGRFMLQLGSYTAAPLVELVERIRECDRFPWWFLSGHTMARTGHGSTTLKTIGDFAFESCEGIKALTLPDGLTSIGEGAFQTCAAITVLTLPQGLTSIGAYAFNGCAEIKALTVPEGVTSIGEGAFQSCAAITALSLPEGLTSIGKYAFRGCSEITTLSLPRGLTSIGECAFNGCSRVTCLSLPASLTSIGKWVFDGFSKITTLTLPDGLTSIGDRAFNGCSGITKLTLPDGLICIGANAFNGCAGITDITLPEGLTRIGKGAFRGCTGITSLTLPDSLTYVGTDVMDDYDQVKIGPPDHPLLQSGLQETRSVQVHNNNRSKCCIM